MGNVLNLLKETLFYLQLFIVTTLALKLVYECGLFVKIKENVNVTIRTFFLPWAISPSLYLCPSPFPFLIQYILINLISILFLPFIPYYSCLRAFVQTVTLPRTVSHQICIVLAPSYYQVSV